MNYIIIKFDLSEWVPRFEITQETKLTDALKIVFNEIEDSIHYNENIIITLSEVEANQKWWKIDSESHIFPINSQPLLAWTLDGFSNDENSFDCVFDEFKQMRK